MESINEHRVRRRISNVWDTYHASQVDEKGVKQWLKPLETSIGIEKESMGSASDFNKEIGSI